MIDTAGIDPAWAATLSCSGLATYSAAAKLIPIPSDEWVAVIGAGGLGLMAIAMLRAFGHERIIAVDVDEKKLSATGLTGTVDARKTGAEKKLTEIAGGPIYGAMDFVGSSETTRLALGVLGKGGRLVLVGLYGGEIQLSLVTTVQRALTIQGSHLGSLAELQSVVALARAGKLKPIPVETRPLSEVNRTLDELQKGRIVGRVVVEI
ncbi:MAG: zinc-binding dehydrogenase [Deltaproteobacteria bacterium]|nr:zinc-binding dehydrogenase [Deltaproteobacteria bacterium]